jgi:hypothetical protein
MLMYSLWSTTSPSSSGPSEDAEVVTPHVSKPYDYVNHMFMRP